MQFHQLIYISHANGHLGEPDLAKILNSARHNNRKLLVTGMLLFSNKTFFQVLEGAKANVQQLYDKIEKDRRHRAAVTLVERTVPIRSFPNWSMGFERVASTDVDTRAFFEIESAEAVKRKMPAGLTDDVLKLVSRYAEKQVRAA